MAWLDLIYAHCNKMEELLDTLDMPPPNSPVVSKPITCKPITRKPITRRPSRSPKQVEAKEISCRRTKRRPSDDSKNGANKYDGCVDEATYSKIIDGMVKEGQKGNHPMANEAFGGARRAVTEELHPRESFPINKKEEQ